MIPPEPRPAAAPVVRPRARPVVLGQVVEPQSAEAVEPRLDELATFFPGLLFGWLRARRDGIGAAVVLHALSNLFAETLVRGWLM